MGLSEFMIHNGSMQPKTPELKETQFAGQLYHSLRERGWIVFEEEWDSTGKNRIDAIITRQDVGIFIGIELKVPNHLDEETRALRQLIEYSKLKFSYQPKLLAMLTPTERNDTTIRFFWRWGFGMTNYKNDEIVFVNGERKNTIYFERPEKSPPWDRNTPEKTAEIVTRMEKYR